MNITNASRRTKSLAAGLALAVATIGNTPTAGTMAGGWSESAVDQTTEEAVAFVLSRMNTTGKLKHIVRVKKQVVNGTNYDITFELDNNTAWNAVVYRSLSGEFSITRASKVE